MTDTTAPRPDDEKPGDTAEQPTVEQPTESASAETAPTDAGTTEAAAADAETSAAEPHPAREELVEPVPVAADPADAPVEPAPTPEAPAPATESAADSSAEAAATPAASDAAEQPVSTSAEAAPTAAAGTTPQVVYVDAPQRPKKRGTRGVGVAVVLLSTGIFALLYALATIVLALALRPAGLNGFTDYLASAPFFVPVLVFAGAHLLLVIIANRAGWWMHVLGGFLVAVLVWVAFLGAALIAAGALGAPQAQQQAVVVQQLINPLGIIAAVLAREIPIWVGGIVSRRGRTQAAKNAEAQAAYERDLAAHRASVAPKAPTG